MPSQIIVTGGGAPRSAPYIVIASGDVAGLDAERIFQEGTNIEFSDSGPNSPLQIGVSGVPEFEGVIIDGVILDVSGLADGKVLAGSGASLIPVLMEGQAGISIGNSGPGTVIVGLVDTAVN